MKSKAHYKKCVELGLNPLPSSVDDDSCLDDDQEDSSMASSSCGDRQLNMADGDEDSDTEDCTDGEDGENESISGKNLSKLPKENLHNISFIFSKIYRHRRATISLTRT